MPLRVCLLCAILLDLSMCGLSKGQDPFSGGGDPFGGNTGDPFGTGSVPTGNDPFSTAAAGPAADSGFGGFASPASPALSTAAADNTTNQTAANETDPVVRLLRESPPSTISDMAQALTWMNRIRRWDEVGRLLDRVQTFGWDLESKAALAREGGSALWIRLRSRDVGLTDQQRSLVGEILSAPAQLARDPKSIDGWIDKLGSDAPSERRLAQLRLQDGSTASISQLIKRLLNGDPKVAPVMLAGTVYEFGEDGIGALQAASHVAAPQRSGRLLLALAELPGRDFAAELGAAVASRSMPADVKRQLNEILNQRFGKLPSDGAVQVYLEKQFKSALADYQRARVSGSGLTNIVWRLTPDRQSIQLAEAPSHARELERLSQIAALRLQLEQLDLSGAVESVVPLLQRAYQVNPQLVDAEINSQLLTDLPDPELVRGLMTEQTSLAAGAEFWRAAFEQADQWQMHGAALRSLQMLAATPAAAIEQINFLSDLLADPRPMIRYSALQTIDAIDPTVDYRGSDQAIATALEMTKLQAGPQSLVIGLQSHLRQAAQLQIQMQTNAEVTTVNSAQSALLFLDKVVPIEMIFVVDRVADQSLFELLQRLRKSRMGHAIPIAVLTDQLYSYERDLMSRTPGVISSVLSRNSDNMSRVIDLMIRDLDTQPLSPANRFTFSQIGGNFLVRIAGDRDRYGFYHVSDFRESLVSTAAVLSAPSQTKLLSGLGTADSQRNLFQLAATSSPDETERRAAANAFADSVKRFGLRLDRTSVADCYELYNRLGPQDPVSTKTLGFCLDVIEAQAGKAAWPERL